MTEEEADYWDEYYTKNPPKIDPSKNGTGFFTRRKNASLSTNVDTVDTQEVGNQRNKKVLATKH